MHAPITTAAVSQTNEPVTEIGQDLSILRGNLKIGVDAVVSATTSRRDDMISSVSNVMWSESRGRTSTPPPYILRQSVRR